VDVISFKEIRPPDMDWDGIRLPIIHEFNVAADWAIKRFDATAKYWKSNKPVFKKSIQTNKFFSSIGFLVETDNKIWGYIDKGIKTQIRPNYFAYIPSGSGNVRGKKRGTWRVYDSGSSPNSVNVASNSSEVGKQETKGEYLSLNQSFKWGITARNFSALIEKDLYDPDKYAFRRKLQEAMNRGAKVMFRKQGETYG